MAISILMTLKLKPSVFHNKICPFGVLQKFAGKFSKYSKNVLRDNCIGCKLCETVCKADAIKVLENNKADILKENCFQCSNCRDSMP